MNLPPDLPTGPMEPLPPRHGALDDVRASARARRNRRRAALGSGVTVLLLALSIPFVLRDGDEAPPQRVQTADDDREGAVSSTSSTSVVEVEEEGTDDSPTTSAARPVKGVAETPPPSVDVNDPAFLVGRAIDPDGRPLANISVYNGSAAPGGVRDALTDEGGWYQVRCPTEAVVLSGVVISTAAGDHTFDSNWAPVVVQAPAGGALSGVCGSGAPVVTTLRHGGVIQGRVVDPSWPDAYSESAGGVVHVLMVEVAGLPWTPTDCNWRPICHYLEVITSHGPEFTFQAVGLPTGDHDVYVHGDEVDEYEITTVHVEAGQITQVDLHAPTGP